MKTTIQYPDCYGEDEIEIFGGGLGLAGGGLGFAGDGLVICKFR